MSEQELATSATRNLDQRSMTATSLATCGRSQVESIISRSIFLGSFETRSWPLPDPLPSNKRQGRPRPQTVQEDVLRKDSLFAHAEPDFLHSVGNLLSPFREFIRHSKL